MTPQKFDELIRFILSALNFAQNLTVIQTDNRMLF